jgi:hypothetical protein
MKLKQKLGIRSNFFMDLLYSVLCPCCAVGQEAMAVDEELGTAVECCFDLRSQRSMPLRRTSPEEVEELESFDHEYMTRIRVTPPVNQGRMTSPEGKTEQLITPCKEARDAGRACPDENGSKIDKVITPHMEAGDAHPAFSGIE